jgi:hypothetical protein
VLEGESVAPLRKPFTQTWRVHNFASSFCCSIMADRTTSDDSAGSGALAARALVRPCTHAPGVARKESRGHTSVPPLAFLCAPPNLRTCIPGCAQFITQLGPFWSAVRSAVDGPYLSLSRSVLASAPLRPLRPLLVTYISLSLSAPLLGVRRGYCVSSL